MHLLPIHRFWFKGAIVIGLVSSIGVLSLGMVQAKHRYEATLQAQQVILSTRVDDLSIEVRSFLSITNRQMRAVLNLPWSEDGWLDRIDLKMELDRLLQLIPQAAGVSVCGGNGRYIAVHTRSERISSLKAQRCMERETDPSISVHRGDRDRPIILLSLSAPEFGPGSVLTLKLDMRLVSALMKSSLMRGDGIENVVLGGDGQIVMHADSLRLLDQGSPFDQLDGWIYAKRNIPDTDWVVVGRQSDALIKAETLRSIWPVVTALSLSWLAALAISVMLARRLSRPITEISQSVEAFAGGHLDARVHVADEGELGRLAKQFNRMADVVQRSQEELEGLVAERTQDLAQANDQLATWSKELEQRVADKLREVERLSELKRFFSPRLAESLVAEDRGQVLESHRREATVMFVDLRGFTAFAEAAPAERVMAVLREFHAEAGRLIFEHEGTLERFTGDGMMVFFNDPDPMPDHAGRAVALACSLRDRAAALMQGWQSDGAGPSGVGIGLSLGQATIGPIGFESRVDYAAIGTVTNRAARLCAEAAAGEVLICSALHQRLDGRLQLLGSRQAQLKGLQAPETCYAVASIDTALTSAPAVAG